MSRLVHAFYQLLLGLSCLSMLAAFGTVSLSVIARQMGWDVPGLDAYAGYAIACALFLALPGTLKNGDHIRVTLLLARLRPGWRGAFEWGCLGAGLALTAYMAWYAVRLVWLSYVTHDISPAADVTPLWIPQLGMALGFLGFALSFLQALLMRWRGQAFIAESTESAHIE